MYDAGEEVTIARKTKIILDQDTGTFHRVYVDTGEEVE